LKKTYEYLEKFERLRTSFLDKDNTIQVCSPNTIIDKIEKQIFDNRLELGNQEGSFNLSEKMYHNYFDKLEIL
jgi:hypothetical protein